MKIDIMCHQWVQCPFCSNQEEVDDLSNQLCIASCKKCQAIFMFTNPEPECDGCCSIHEGELVKTEKVLTESYVNPGYLTLRELNTQAEPAWITCNDYNVFPTLKEKGLYQQIKIKCSGSFQGKNCTREIEI